MLLKMQPRPSPYSIPSSLHTFQKGSSYGNVFSEFMMSPNGLGYNSFPPTSNVYQNSSYSNHTYSTSTTSCNNYLYPHLSSSLSVNAAVLGENSYNGSPNGSTSSPIPSPQSPARTFSPSNTCTGNTTDVETPTSSSSSSYELSPITNSPHSENGLYKYSYPTYPSSGLQSNNYYQLSSSSSSSSSSSYTSPLNVLVNNSNTDQLPFSNGHTHGLVNNYGYPGGNYGNTFSSNSGSYLPTNSTSSPYPEYLTSHYPSQVSISSTGSSFALWNYPSLPVGQFPKVSYDTPRFKLTPERAIPLIKWFEDHKDHPYPSRHEKMLLCQATQLTFTQVSTWFANARRRMKKAVQDDDDEDGEEEVSSDDSADDKLK